MEQRSLNINNHWRAPLSFCLLALFILHYLPSGAQNWKPLGKGSRAQVRSLFSDTVDNLLYLGGNFKTFDGKNIRGIASWDGTKWDSLGSGIDDYSQSSTPNNVLTICRYNNDIYIGGAFKKTGGVWAQYIARWDGTKWDSLPENINAPVDAMIIYNNELYVSGEFTKAGSVSANGVAKWNGTSWSGVGVLPFINISIYSIIFYEDELYVGGIFQDSIGDAVNIAKWTGQKWLTVGGGITGNFGAVNCMEIYNNKLYVAGLFYTSDGNAGNHIAKWDGTSWSDVGGGMGGNAYPQVRDMEVFNDELYVVGVLQTAGGVPADRIAKWNGTEWCGLGSVFDNTIGKLAIYNDTLHIGGGFWTIDGDSINYIAKWTGGSYTDTCGVISSTNEKEEISQKDIVIYPNPFHSSATLSLNLSSVPDKGITFLIYNIMGMEVKRIAHIKSGQVVINRGNLPVGIYFYQVWSENEIPRTGKLMIH